MSGDGKVLWGSLQLPGPVCAVPLFFALCVLSFKLCIDDVYSPARNIQYPTVSINLCKKYTSCLNLLAQSVSTVDVQMWSFAADLTRFQWWFKCIWHPGELHFSSQNHKVMTYCSCICLSFSQLTPPNVHRQKCVYVNELLLSYAHSENSRA